MKLRFIEDCHKCDAEMALEIVILDEIENNTIVFPVNHLGQQTWECPKCGLMHYTGDIEILSDDDLS